MNIIKSRALGAVREHVHKQSEPKELTKKARVDTSIPFVVTLTGHSGPVNAVAILLGGTGNNLVASGSDDCTIKLWNPWTHTCEETLIGHADAVTCLAVGTRSGAESGSQFLVSGSKDAKLQIWSKDTESDRWQLRDARDTLGVHGDGPVSCVAVMKNQQGDDMVVSGSEDGAVSFWDLSKGVRVGMLKSERVKDPISYVLALHDHKLNTNSVAERKLVATSGRLWQLVNRPKCEPEYEQLLAEGKTRTKSIKEGMDKISADDLIQIKAMFAFTSDTKLTIKSSSEQNIRNASAVLMLNDVDEAVSRALARPSSHL
jgi:hypothetical protein